ncbi:Golgi-associated RAB2 interactor protein 5B [Suncus etruscus]|uniref:Golgi-associated RAB2 interactor protein 5B n=1 Tax=Suncus etruscus TaxID=109475 RepID=UPI0021100CEE|nr:Golgi-associated RAB2 interactor protein 5B [Suncus etruscus]
MNRFWNRQRGEPEARAAKWVPTLGGLQKALRKGEYLPLRPLPMFESDFVQVTNRGSPVFVHHRPNRVTIGVAASLPGLLLPDLLLMGQPGDEDAASMVLTRIIPLDLVHLYVHELAAWRLKLRLVTGRYYYLELDAPHQEGGFLFNRWIRLINLLQDSVSEWAPHVDLNAAVAPPSTWRLQPLTALSCAGPEGALQKFRALSPATVLSEPSFPFSVLASRKTKKAKKLGRRFKSQAAGSSLPLVWSQQLEKSQTSEKKGEKEASPGELGPTTSQDKEQVAGKHSVTIKTIFSIISETVNNPSSTQAARRPRGWGLPILLPSSLSSALLQVDSDYNATPLGGLVETVRRCIPIPPSNPSLLGSFDHLNRRLWEQDVEQLMDPESSSVSSSSVSSDTLYPSFQKVQALLALHKYRGKTSGSLKKQGAVPQKRAPSTRSGARKAPMLLGPTQKALPTPAASRKGAKAPEPREVGSLHKVKIASSQGSAPRLKGRSQAAKPATTSAIRAPGRGQGLSIGSGKEHREPKRPLEAKGNRAPSDHRPQPRTVGLRGMPLPPGAPKGEEKPGEDSAFSTWKTVYVERTGFQSTAQQRKLSEGRMQRPAGSLEQKHPISVEGLTVAELLIIAARRPKATPDDKDPAPSRLPGPHQHSVSTGTQVDQVGPEQKDGGPGMAQKISRMSSKVQEPIKGSRVEEKEVPRQQREASHLPAHTDRPPVSQVPIPLPQSTWEEVSPTPHSQTPITALEKRVTQFKRGLPKSELDTPRSMVATMGSTSENRLKSLREVESKNLPVTPELEEKRVATAGNFENFRPLSLRTLFRLLGWVPVCACTRVGSWRPVGAGARSDAALGSDHALPRLRTSGPSHERSPPAPGTPRSPR